MTAQFEEKTYETYFNAELATKTSVFFPLGQVQEGFLGFDSSAFSRSRPLWSVLGFPLFPSRFSGVDLRDIADDMEHFLGVEIDHMPRMKVNLLFQYKRPDYISSKNGKEWVHWKSPYYRYNIYQDQQQLLMRIHKQFNKTLLLLYAAPAIHDVDELVTRMQHNEIIKYSNFQHCDKLSGHNRNTYKVAGKVSIACSEPERLENINLVQLIEQYGSDNEYVSESNRQFIANFRKAMVSVVSEDPIYGSALQQLNASSQEVLARTPLFYSFIAMQNIKHLTGLQWLVKV